MKKIITLLMVITMIFYILKNSYVWSGNIPEDILAELPIIE